MINLETFLVPKIAQRCKKLRESYGLKMELISDKAAISRIEKEICPKSGNFITETVLLNYTDIFELSPEEIIFGKKKNQQVFVTDRSSTCDRSFGMQHSGNRS